MNLNLTDRSIYENDPYMLMEWHFYAAGSNKQYITIKKTGRVRLSL